MTRFKGNFEIDEGRGDKNWAHFYKIHVQKYRLFMLNRFECLNMIKTLFEPKILGQVVLI